MASTTLKNPTPAEYAAALGITPPKAPTITDWTPPLPGSGYAGAPRAFIAAHPKLLAKETLTRLGQLQKAWAECQDAINQSGDIQNKLDVARRSVARKMNLGEAVNPTLVSPEEIARDQEQVRLLADERQRQIGQEVLEIAKQIFPTIIQAYDEWSLRLMEKEANIYREGGVSYETEKSHFCNSVRAAGSGLRSKLQSITANRRCGSPRDVFPFLDL